MSITSRTAWSVTAVVLSSSMMLLAAALLVPIASTAASILPAASAPVVNPQLTSIACDRASYRCIQVSVTLSCTHASCRMTRKIRRFSDRHKTPPANATAKLKLSTAPIVGRAVVPLDIKRPILNVSGPRGDRVDLVSLSRCVSRTGAGGGGGGVKAFTLPVQIEIPLPPLAHGSRCVAGELATSRTPGRVSITAASR